MGVTFKPKQSEPQILNTTETEQPMQSEQQILNTTEPQLFTIAQIQALGASAPQRLNTAELCKKIGIGRASLYNYMNQGRFPQPDLRIKNTVSWSLSLIEKWMKEHPEGIKYKKPAPV